MTFKASKRSEINPFYAMEMLKEANEMESNGANIMHLEVGEPSTGAPSKVIEEAKRIINDNIPVPYTNALGLVNLRESISKYYLNSKNLEVSPGNIVVTTGTSGGFVLALLASFDVGDRVAIFVPGYPAYKNMLISLGLNPIEIYTNEENGFQPTLTQIKNFKNLDGIIISSPSNPTGSMIKNSLLKEICEYCDEQGIRLLSDEIYHGITYEQDALSIFNFSQNGIILNGFSKYFCMTGWRLGWMVIPDSLIKPIEKLSQNLFISSNSLSQMVACKAFECEDEIKEVIGKYKKNRDKILDTFHKLGINKIAPSEGAFYIYADISHLTNDSMVFCKSLLKEAGVAITPGVDFDVLKGKSFIRLSYACDNSIIAESSKRITDWIKGI